MPRRQNRPDTLAHIAPAISRAILPPSPPPSSKADAIVPWLVSGGSLEFLNGWPAADPSELPERNGIQLVCSVYIPPGSIGFLKSLRVAPYRPAIFDFFDVQLAEDIDPPTHYNYRSFSYPNPPSAFYASRRPVSYWHTPMGWEAEYEGFGPVDPQSNPPSWRWTLRLIKGNIDDLRIGAKNLEYPVIPESLPIPLETRQSLYLWPNIAVPASIYPGSLPGSSLGQYFSDQRYQIIQGDQLELHVPIPENTTLALFTRWRQVGVNVLVANKSGPNGTSEIIHPEFDTLLYPLLPSFGQMAGYTQHHDQAAGVHNSQYGW